MIKLFPNENILLNKKFNNRKPDIWFKNDNLAIEVDEGNQENHDTDDEKQIEDMLKKHKFFDVIPMVLILIFLNL